MRSKIIVNEQSPLRKWSLEQLLKFHFIYEICFTSYEAYEFFTKNFNILAPSRSVLNNFKLTLAKYKIFETIHKDYVGGNNNFKFDSIYTDSSFIQNMCMTTNSKIIGRNPYNNNKFGTKISVIAIENGFPYDVDISNSCKHDAEIATSMINGLQHDKYNKSTLLADSGYDSKKLCKLLKTKKIKHIIPKNRRNKDPKNVKAYKKELNNEISEIKNKKKENIKLNKNNKKEIINIKEIACTNIKFLQEKIKNARKACKNTKSKNKTYNIGIGKVKKVLYKKRARVEHTFGFLKHHKLDKIRDKTLSTFKNTVYGRILDMIICRDNKFKDKI